MNLQALKDELANDPESLGYTGKTDADAAEMLMGRADGSMQTRLRKLNSREVLTWAAGNGRLAHIKDATEHAIPAVRALALAAMLLIERETTQLDLADAGVIGMIDTLIAQTPMTADDKTALLAAGTESASRASVLGLGRVTTADIAKARQA